MGKYLEEEEDVYRFQELDNPDENNGALLDQGHDMVSNVSNGKQPFNPDELYFNDMDIKAWEQRTGESDGLAYGEDYGYGYMEDEGYHEDAGDMLPADEYGELLFQSTLDKIRYARATGETDVSLTPEELSNYRNRLWQQRVSAAQPKARARPFSVPVIPSDPDVPAVAVSSNTGEQAATSPRKKSRSSFFGGKSKKEKAGNRTRKSSNATESSLQNAPPGFRVPGPNGQTIFTPINGYEGYNSRDMRSHQPGAPLRPGSRHSSGSNERHIPPNNKNTSAKVSRPQQTTSRIATSREIPGAFPSSPTSLRMPSSPQQDHVDIQSSSGVRSRSSTVQQPPKLVPFPVVEYKHHNAEPFQYQSAGHLAQSSSQPQYARRMVPAEPYTAMPRRVPVPVQHAGVQGVHGSYSDPAISPTAGSAASVNENTYPRAQAIGVDGDSSAQSVKSVDKHGSSSGSKESENRRKGGRRRRKS